jgi:hypothetical protein
MPYNVPRKLNWGIPRRRLKFKVELHTATIARYRAPVKRAQCYLLPQSFVIVKFEIFLLFCESNAESIYL